MTTIRTTSNSAIWALASALALSACTGADGEQGEKGDKGDTGEQGATGATGAQGDKGDKGDTGEQGTTGATGATGAQGEPGDEGEPGTPGPQGATGATGATGEQGEQGEPGESGVEEPLIVGSLTEWVKARVEAIKDGTEAEGDFVPVPNILTDEVETALGLQSNVVVRWLDPLTFSGGVNGPRFGANGDFTAYFGDTGGAFGAIYDGSSSAGWLWSNHEYISGDPPNHLSGGAAPNSQALQFANFLSDLGQLTVDNVAIGADWNGMTADQSAYIAGAKQQIGGSWFRVVQDADTGEWTIDKLATSRRYDGSEATKIKVVGATLSNAPADNIVNGSQNNCSGAHTPWGTVLNGEENVQDFFGDLEPFFNDNGGFTADPSGDANATSGGPIVLDYAAVATSAWGRNPDTSKVYPKDHYGYVTEFDVGAAANLAYDSTSGNGHQKLGAMGRARWENATFALGDDWKLVSGQPIVVYSGDDRRGGRIFKFVTSQNWTTGMTKAQTRNLLADGKLYVAHFTDLQNDGTGLTLAGDVTPTAGAPGNGVWIELSLSNTTQDAPNAPALGAGTKVGAALASNTWNGMGGFADDNLVRSVLYTASNKIGVKELNRPEDLEFNPTDDSIYIAFTNHNRGTALLNDGTLRVTAGTATGTIDAGGLGHPSVGNTGRPDRNGAIFVMKETTPATPGTSATFTFWAAWNGRRIVNSSDPYIASCPDNIVIDAEGGVWFGTDGNPGNNNRADSVYYLDLEESTAYRVATTPSDAEFTGPSFTPDGSTLFFNVQHPGESWTSLWPGDSPYGSLSSLVAVTPKR